MGCCKWIEKNCFIAFAIFVCMHPNKTRPLFLFFYWLFMGFVIILMITLSFPWSILHILAFDDRRPYSNGCMYRTAACIAATGVSINVFACLAVLHATVLVQFYAWEAALAGWAVTYRRIDDTTHVSRRILYTCRLYPHCILHTNGIRLDTILRENDTTST
jgi:hypothetical protein